MADKEMIKELGEEALRAAYALNMCTVSVSQIVDYNDVYILEQEYDAILNNLNLEKIPKDDALLKILVELLNTITFFRIQELRKEMIEKDYQRRMKNAIWSAIPSLNIIAIPLEPATLAISLATQIGSGYMNYRKEKAQAASEKEKAKMELQMTAMEQFNALKRELFTTAWRLADAYQFPDEYRLTEKQIKQYNEILMDRDEFRKYERLDAISDKFMAYPPFWYFFGHTANLIATSKEFDSQPEIKALYHEKAKAHFEQYEKLNRFNILREDTISAAFALEYIDLLMLETSPNYNKIKTLINTATSMCGNANDLLQLCAIAYLKIGEAENAATLLRRLVNEDYNTATNAKLLSRIYVSTFLNTKDDSQKINYDILASRVNKSLLFPMPPALNTSDEELQAQYITEQKHNLQVEYRKMLNAFIKKYIIRFNRVMPAPNGDQEYPDEYFDYTPASKKRRCSDIQKVMLEPRRADDYRARARNVGLRLAYLDVLEDTITALDTLACFREHPKRELLVRQLRSVLIDHQSNLTRIQAKLEGETFAAEDYADMQSTFSFEALTGAFFDQLKLSVAKKIEGAQTLSEIDALEFDLAEFCQKQALSISDRDAQDHNIAKDCTRYFSPELLGAGNELEQRERAERMLQAIKDAISTLTIDGSHAAVLLQGSPEFDIYFSNTRLTKVGAIKSLALAVLDDQTERDYDLLLCSDGFRTIKRNDVSFRRDYGLAKYAKSGESEELDIGWPDKYVNKHVNIGVLARLMEKLHALQCNKEGEHK